MEKKEKETNMYQIKALLKEKTKKKQLKEK